jgi:hypothetical protein
LLIIQQMTQTDGIAFTEAIFAPWRAAGVVDVELEMILSVGLIVVMAMMQWYERYIANIEQTFINTHGWVRWLAYIAMAIAVANLGAAIETPFIYFQF